MLLLRVVSVRKVIRDNTRVSCHLVSQFSESMQWLLSWQTNQSKEE